MRVVDVYPVLNCEAWGCGDCFDFNSIQGLCGLSDRVVEIMKCCPKKDEEV